MSLINFNFLLDSIENEEDMINLCINDYQIKCSKSHLSEISPVVSQYFEDNPSATEYYIKITKNEMQEDIIQSIFQNQAIQVNSQNDQFINEFATILQIQPLEDISENWEINELQETEAAVFDVDESILNEFSTESKTDEKIFDSKSRKLKAISDKQEIVGKETLCRLIINACISRPKRIQVYINLIFYLKIEEVFCRIILHEMEMLDGAFSIRAEKVQITCYLVRFFYDKGYIKGKKIQSLYKNLPVLFADLSDNPFLVSKELQRNNWSKFKKYASEGMNPDPISRILRYDDIDSFQSIACMPKFDINKKIKMSDFEVCDFINHRPCSYLEFCAFFGSIKCFKYIYLNEESQKSGELIKYAVAGGNAEIIHICEHDGVINYKETREIAVKFHHWDIFEWLSENKYQSNCDQFKLPIEDTFSLLNQSIQFTNITTFSYLIYNDADYNLALPFAIDFDNVLLTKWLFKHKQNLFKDEGSRSVIKSFLHFACRNENIEMLKLILSQKDYCNVNSKYEGKTPIIIAIEKENYELYKILINKKKIKLDIPDFSGKQVIHFACEYKNLEILEDLLNNKLDKIDINCCDKNNNTPLLLACEKGNLKAIKLLFKYCKDKIILDVKNKLGLTPILSVCNSKKKKKRLQIIQIIYENIKNEDKERIINEKGPMKKTLLHFACEKNESEIVKFLLSLPTVNVNSVDDDERTPLISSVYLGSTDIIELLLNHPQIDLNIKDKNQKIAYDVALNRGIDNEITKKLKAK